MQVQGEQRYQVSNASSPIFKFELPNWAQCSLLPCWNKRLKKKKNAQIQLFLPHLALGGSHREKAGTDPVKKPSCKKQTSSEMSGKDKDVRQRQTQNSQGETSIDLSASASAQLLGLTSSTMLTLQYCLCSPSCCRCTRLLAVVAALGTAACQGDKHML